MGTIASGASVITPSSPVVGPAVLPIVIETAVSFMRSPSSTSDAVVIVGGGFGGLFTALALQRRQPGCPIVLVEPRDRFLFQPLLYELLSDELQTWEVAPRYDQLLNNSICWIQDTVVRIDQTSQSIELDSGDRLGWAQLVLATGSKANDFGIPGVREHSSGFRDLSDVGRLKQWLNNVLKQRDGDAGLIIVGAGPTGVELACKLADLIEGAASIRLVEMGDEILPGSTAFNREKAQAALERKGVVVQLKTSVSEVQASSAVLADGMVLRHAGLIWTAGSSPSIPAISPPPVLERGRLAVNDDLRLVGSANTFGLGDISARPDSPWPASAQVAMQQGDATAASIASLRIGEEPQPFQFEDRGEMLSLGVGDATLTGMGFTLAGPLAFQLRRATYLTRLPGLSLGLRSAGAWLLSR
jgi:NADH dehydrogenase